MNNLLDITGHFLYLALNIILLPVFVALDCFLGLWIALKFCRKTIYKLRHSRNRQKQINDPAFKKSLVLLRAKFVGVHANGH
jgi:hypothetical protein